MQKRRRTPLISSVDALRALAAGITILSLVGMTAYAGDHLRNSAAPLQPSAMQAAAPTAAPTTSTTTTTGRLQLSRGVATTTAPAVTKTHRS